MPVDPRGPGRALSTELLLYRLRNLAPLAPHEIELSLDDFKSEFAANGSVDRKALNFWCESPGSGAKIFVFYADERNVGVKTMRTFVQTLETHDISAGIIIWSDKMTASARKVSAW